MGRKRRLLISVYHGELIAKSEAMNRFYEVTDAQADYDFSRILAVLEVIISECVTMRERSLLEEIETEIRAYTDEPYKR